MDRFPVLLIGGKVSQFKQGYRGVIHSLGNISDVRDFLSEYTGRDFYPGMLVVEDLSFMTPYMIGTLLKFVEGSTLPLVFLSRFDNVSSVFLSRMKTVSKSVESPVRSQFSGIGAVDMDSLRGKSFPNRVRGIAMVSPKLYYFDNHIKRYSVKSRIQDLLK